MTTPSPFHTATAGYLKVPSDWMPASQVRPLVFEDPAVIWLENHGAAHSFQPDDSPYSFQDFVAEKSRQFERSWVERMAPGAVRVCREASEVRQAEKVRQTLDLMQAGVPVIAGPCNCIPNLVATSLPHLNACSPDRCYIVATRAACRKPVPMDRYGHYTSIGGKFTLQTVCRFDR